MDREMDYADIVRADEMQDLRDWMQSALAGVRDPAVCRRREVRPLFSFRLSGKPSTDWLAALPLETQALAVRPGLTRHTFARTDPATGLQVALELDEYADFPVVEWIVRLRNTGSQETPLIEELVGADVLLPASGRPVLHHVTGDFCFPQSYETHAEAMEPGVAWTFAPVGGRPTNRAWPYYNVQSPEAERGAIFVVGWAGQWSATLERPANGECVRARAGQQRLCVALRPGEEIRSSRSIVMLYRGDQARSQNLWRRWMMAHNMPRLDGRLPQPFLGANWGSEMHQADEASQLAFLDRYARERIDLDVWWMDAGWYPCGGTWVPVGTWEVDRVRFPGGLRRIAEHARQRGTRTLVWFEPERVYAGTELWREHPEWLLRSADESRGAAEVERTGTRLLDMGNENARRWLVERVCRLIEQEQIDIYRQDYNIDPLPFWTQNEPHDRVGMREMRCAEGHLAFWAELRKRYPAMLIDTCASGGRRIDIETLRMSAPLHKTDYNYADLTAKQAMHYSLYAWVPFFGAGVCPDEHAYSFRTNMCPATVMGFDVSRQPPNFDEVRRFTDEWRRISHLFFGDYYPLTAESRREDQWIAWQFHRPDLGEGMVQAFRRKDSPFESARFRLRGVDPTASYAVTDLDSPGEMQTMAEQDLLGGGLPVSMSEAPQAKVVTYRRQAGGGQS